MTNCLTEFDDEANEYVLFFHEVRQREIDPSSNLAKIIMFLYNEKTLIEE